MSCPKSRCRLSRRCAPASASREPAMCFDSNFLFLKKKCCKLGWFGYISIILFLVTWISEGQHGFCNLNSVFLCFCSIWLVSWSLEPFQGKSWWELGASGGCLNGSVGLGAPGQSDVPPSLRVVSPKSLNFFHDFHLFRPGAGYLRLWRQKTWWESILECREGTYAIRLG